MNMTAHGVYLDAVLPACLQVHSVKACTAQRDQLHTTLGKALNHLAAAAATTKL
jgi:hypothetical protein